MRDFSGTPSSSVITLQDMVHSLTLRTGAGDSASSKAKLKKATQNALRAIAGKHKWKYYHRQTRVTTSPALTMTIAYDHTGGAQERLVTITAGDNFPDDASYGELKIGDNTYRILERISPTTATLEADFTPSEDYTGTAFWRRTTYQFPREIIRIKHVHNLTVDRPIEAIDYAEMAAYSTGDYVSGWIRYFAWNNQGNNFGSAEITIWPPPESNEIIEVSATVYPHHPTILAITGNDLTGTTGTRVVTSVQGGFDSRMIGTILRVGRSQQPPTEFNSDEWSFQAFVIGVTDENTLEISETLPSTFSGKGFVLSSPIEIEPSVLAECVEDEAFYQYTKNHDHKNTSVAAQIAQKSLMEAIIRDNRTGTSVISDGVYYYPFGFNGIVEVESGE